MKAYPIKASQFLSSIRSCSISALIVFLPACIIKYSFFLKVQIFLVTCHF